MWVGRLSAAQGLLVALHSNSTEAVCCCRRVEQSGTHQHSAHSMAGTVWLHSSAPGPHLLRACEAASGAGAAQRPACHRPALAIH